MSEPKEMEKKEELKDYISFIRYQYKDLTKHEEVCKKEDCLKIREMLCHILYFADSGSEKEMVKKGIGDNSSVDKLEPIRLSSNVRVLEEKEGMPSIHSKLSEFAKEVKEEYEKGLKEGKWLEYPPRQDEKPPEPKRWNYVAGGKITTEPREDEIDMIKRITNNIINKFNKTLLGESFDWLIVKREFLEKLLHCLENECSKLANPFINELRKVLGFGIE